MPANFKNFIHCLANLKLYHTLFFFVKLLDFELMFTDRAYVKKFQEVNLMGNNIVIYYVFFLLNNKCKNFALNTTSSIQRNNC